MALDTKLNLSNQKFEQASGDTLNLSGTTTIFGNLQFSTDQSATFTPRSIIDYGYYSGNTGVIKLQGSGIVNSLKSNIDIIGPGTVTLTSGSTAVIGNGTSFLDSTAGLGINYWWSFHIIDSENRIYRIDLSAIHSNTGATLHEVYSEDNMVANGVYSAPTSVYTGATGTYPYKIVTNYARDLYSFSFGNKSYAKNFSTSFGGSTVAAGQTSFTIGLATFAKGDQSFAMGTYTKATGHRSFAGGWGTLTGKKHIIAAGQTSFIFSENTTSQTVGHGALGNQSVILGGQNHNIPSNAHRSVVLGGSAIKVGSGIVDTVHLPKVRIGLGSGGSLLVDDTNNNIIVRDSTTGELKIRSSSSIGLNNFWKVSGTTTLSNATISGKTTFNIGNSPDTARFDLVTGKIGTTPNVPLISFRHNSGRTVTDGYSDIWLGSNNGNSSSVAGGNIGIGSNNLQSIAPSGAFFGDPWWQSFQGDRNIAIGFRNGKSLTGGAGNAASGNILLGTRVMEVATQLSYNIFMGFQTAMNFNVPLNGVNGQSNIAIGNYSMGDIVSGKSSNNIFLGASVAGNSLSLGDSNVGIGNFVFQNVNTISDSNIGIGNSVFRQSGNIGLHNTGVGSHAFRETVADIAQSTAVGVEAGVFAGGFSNTYIGAFSGFAVRGQYNTTIGAGAGWVNGNDVTTDVIGPAYTGNRSIFLGYQSGYDTTTPAISDVVVIGNNFRPVLEAGTVFIGSLNKIKFVVDTEGTANNSLTLNSDRTATFGGKATYITDYSSGFTKHSLVDVNYVTAHTNTVNGINITGTTYTATTNSEFIGVSGNSSMTLYLPSVPKNYQKIIISDIKGNGFIQNITINGNGKLINGSTSALIDTNYGSITMVYNMVNWSVIAFA